MRLGLKALVVLAAATLGGAAASATELLFRYTEVSGIDFSFEQSSMVTPTAYALGVGFRAPVTQVSSNIGPFSDIFWYNSGVSGMFTTDTSPEYIVLGPQVYSGSEANPVFATGVFLGADHTNGLNGTLTISAVPEPSSWLLMIAGIAGAGLMLRQAEMNTGLRSTRVFGA